MPESLIGRKGNDTDRFPPLIPDHTLLRFEFSVLDLIDRTVVWVKVIKEEGLMHGRLDDDKEISMVV